MVLVLTAKPLVLQTQKSNLLATTRCRRVAKTVYYVVLILYSSSNLWLSPTIQPEENDRIKDASQK